MKTRIILSLLCLLSLNVMGQGTITRQKCKTCGKVISQCQYKGAHPKVPLSKTVNSQNSQGKKVKKSTQKGPEVKRKTISVNGVSFDMIFVEKGCFLYGSDYFTAPHLSKETVGSFYIGETEVSQKLWLAIMGSNPSKHKGALLPVENITMSEIAEFIEKLSFETSLEFRLPTAVEWEYAAKGGKYSLDKDKCINESDNLEDFGWFKENSNGKTHPIKELKPNEIGIYDMMGNVFERTSTKSDYKFERVVSSLPDGVNFIIKGSSIEHSSDFYKVWHEPHFVDTWVSETIGFRLLLAE